MKNCSICIVAVLTLSVIVLTGCSDSGEYQVVEVGGTVSYEGQPVGNIGLIFTPEKGRPSLAVTDDSGRFELYYSQDKSGAQTGPHKVIFEFPPTPLDGSLPKETKPTEAIKAIMKAHGTADSPLSLEITEATDDLKIELP